MSWSVEDRTDLTPAGSAQRTLAGITHVVFHHTVTPATAKPSRIVYTDHRTGRVYPAPYHYLVYPSGRIVKTRPAGVVPVCVAGWNRQVLCVAGVGDWESSDPTTQEFVDACAWLLRVLLAAYPSIVHVVRHKDLNPTSCPGRHFPFERILQEVH
jgi:N-acetyl-anhydromuramyl-L-alanine amidase AmpD